MPEKLLTTKEAADYLNITEEEVANFTKKGELPAYRIGGAFLRFRREQLDAIRKEILPKAGQPAPEASVRTRAKGYERKELEPQPLNDSIADFFYFKDFYIVSAIIAAILIFVILKY